MDLDYILSYTPFIVSIVALLIMIYRVRTLPATGKVTISTPIMQDYPSLLIELTNLRLRRDALRDIITRVYDLADKGKINDDVKRAIIEKINQELIQVEKRIEHLEKYEELNILIEERKRLENEYRRRIKELDDKISSLRKIIGPLPIEKIKKEEKVVRKKEKAEEEKRGVKRDLNKVMEEIMKLLSEAET